MTAVRHRAQALSPGKLETFPPHQGKPLPAPSHRRRHGKGASLRAAIQALLRDGIIWPGSANCLSLKPPMDLAARARHPRLCVCPHSPTALSHTSLTASTGEAPPTRSSAVLLAPDEAGWRELDEKVNEYPEIRVFKGIGTTAGDERARFEAAMVRAIEGVVGVKVPPEAIVTRDSSAGKYVSVSVEVTVRSGEEVAAVFTAIKKEAGGILKWLM